MDFLIFEIKQCSRRQKKARFAENEKRGLTSKRTPFQKVTANTTQSKTPGTESKDPAQKMPVLQNRNAGNH
jgi:hypothetical protein